MPDPVTHPGQALLVAVSTAKGLFVVAVQGDAARECLVDRGANLRNVDGWSRTIEIADVPGLYVWEGSIGVRQEGIFGPRWPVWSGTWRPARVGDLARFGCAALASDETGGKGV